MESSNEEKRNTAEQIFRLACQLVQCTYEATTEHTDEFSPMDAIVAMAICKSCNKIYRNLVLGTNNLLSNEVKELAGKYPLTQTLIILHNAQQQIHTDVWKYNLTVTDLHRAFGALHFPMVNEIVTMLGHMEEEIDITKQDPNVDLFGISFH